MVKRIEWLDSLKGFGIFCVTLGHLSCNYLLETHIYSFHMFLFFFLSGYLHNNLQEDFYEFIVKKSKTLLIPFLFWNVTSFGAGLVLNIPIMESISEFFLLNGQICWNAPIWFLLLLYMVEISFFLIEKYIPMGEYFIIPILLIFWIFFSTPNIFLKINILPVCLLFYIFGKIYFRLSDKVSQNGNNKKRSIFIILLYLFVSLLFGTYLNERISFTGAFFGNVGYCCMAAISGVLFYTTAFQRFRFLRDNKVLSYLGKNSLIIMATQYWLFTLFDLMSGMFFEISIWKYRSTLKALVVALITMTIICFIVERLKKISKDNIALRKICIWAGINIK